MRVIQQTTLGRAIALAGVALHSGAPASVTLRPAGPAAGIAFRRLDAGARVIYAAPGAISASRLGTSLRNSAGDEIATVEHLMAAFALCEVDNALVDVDGPELPILDGSAAPFVAAIEKVGTKALGAPREALRIMAPIEATDGDRFISAQPSAGRELELSIDFPDAAIGLQRLTIDLNDAAAIRRLARARTFCRRADIEAMRAAGFGRGGSLDNAIVVDGAAILNPSGLRDPDEFALHKGVDLIGDLRLAGGAIIGRIFAHRPGHELNARFVRLLATERAAVERIVLPDEAALLQA